MKTITIKQPWASLIVEPDPSNVGFAIKPIENRTWPTKYRGRVLVHAAAKGWKWIEVLNYLSENAKAVLNNFGYDATWLRQLPTSEIIGSVEIVDCVVNHESIWAEQTAVFDDIFVGTTYNWVLANPIKFPEPIPAKGKLSFWDYPNIIAEPEEKNGELFCHCQIPVDEKVQVMSLCGDFTCRYCGGRWYK